MPSDRFPSSIPTLPDDLSRWELQNDGYWHKTAPKGRACPDVGDEMMRVRDLPKLYAHWAEDLRDRMHDAVKQACPEYEDTNQGLIPVELCRALGLGDRSS